MARYDISVEEMAALTAHPVKDVKLWLRGLHRVPEGIEILIENKARYVDMLPTALSSFIPVTARGRKLRRPVGE